MSTVTPNERELEIATEIDADADAEEVAQRIADYREELLTKAQQAVAGVINVGGPSDVNRVFAQLREGKSTGASEPARGGEAEPSGAIPKSDELDKQDAIEEP